MWIRQKIHSQLNQQLDINLEDICWYGRKAQFTKYFAEEIIVKISHECQGWNQTY